MDQHKHERIRATVNSRIRRKGFLNNCLKIVLYDIKKVLWYPCADIDTFRKLCHNFEKSSKWKWTFDKDTNELLEWKALDWSCIIL